MTEVAQVEIDGGVGIVTLNRPQARNAVNAELSQAVGDALARLDADPAVHAVILTGAGPVFCAGADLKALAARQSVYHPDHPEWGLAGMVNHVVEIPVIAAVNGPAMGGGAEIVLASDLAVMAHHAVLGLPEVTRGLVPAAGGVVRLPRQMPPKVAMAAILTGEPIAAADALTWGLVNEVVPAEEVVDRALRLAHAIARNGPLAVREAKRLVSLAAATVETDGDPVWQAQADAFGRILFSDDAKEGATAFAEKRPPVWQGR